MYVNIDAKFLDKTREKANKEAIAEIGEDGTNNLLYPELEGSIDTVEVEDERIWVTFNNKLGSFCVEIPLDIDILEQLLSVVIKRMNKIKNLLKSLK